MQNGASQVTAGSTLPLKRVRSASSLRADFPHVRLKSRHVISGEEISYIELKELLELALFLKKERARGMRRPLLQGRQLALYFEKPSLRTRVSFTVAMNELGGDAIEIIASNTKGEEPEDTARVLAGFCDGVMARTFLQSTVERMAAVSTSSIINGLSDLYHPCQGLADVLTLQERFGSLEGLSLAYVGDGNNVLHSLLLYVPMLGGEVRYACPAGYEPNSEILGRCVSRAVEGRGRIVACASPEEAVRGAQAIYTDVWTSMGFEQEKKAREQAFWGYQVNEHLHSLADKGAAIMHCLPMNRGQEISTQLPDHPDSVIFKQSENRLHAQKALLVGLLT